MKAWIETGVAIGILGAGLIVVIVTFKLEEQKARAVMKTVMHGAVLPVASAITTLAGCYDDLPPATT